MSDDPRGHADGGCTGGNVCEDHGIGADPAIIADHDSAKNAGAATNVHAIADGWNLTRFFRAGDSKRRVLADLNVVADGVSVQDDRAVMPRSDIERLNVAFFDPDCWMAVA